MGRFALPASDTALRFKLGLFGASTETRKTKVLVTRADRTESQLLVMTPAADERALFPPASQVFATFLRLGGEHILAGPDHLLFLLIVLATGWGWRPVLLALTAFTAGHACTLTLSLLGGVSLPAAVVEPAIALTIVGMALFDAWSQRRGRRPALVTTLSLVFGCALVHGLGLAGALQEGGLDNRHRLLSLLGFNMGVELAQLAVALLVAGLPVAVQWLKRQRADGTGRHPLAQRGAVAERCLGGCVVRHTCGLAAVSHAPLCVAPAGRPSAPREPFVQGLLHARALIAFALALLQAAPALARQTGRPNILLIIAGDMGTDASRCYEAGRGGAPMPNLERLCAAGLVFDNAYSAPVCSPTKAGIMSGRHGFRTGVGAAIPPRGGTGLAPDGQSLFERVAPTGYRSALIGKWHLAGDASDLDHPKRLGVPSYFGLFSGAVRDYENWDAVDNGKPVKAAGYATSVLTDRAIDWIGAQTQPWFLWLAYNAPHSPFHLPPQGLHKAGALPTDAASIQANPKPYYQAALQALDTEIGRLLAALPAAVRDDTVLIFIGDNGTPGQIARERYGAGRAKGSLYEGGTHVPMVVAGPGVRVGRADDLVNTTDLHATIAALAGARSTAPDAVDLSPVLHGKGRCPRSHAYVEHFSTQPTRGPDGYGWAIRDARHKLVAPEQGAPQLYDLQVDPLERVDLLAGAPLPSQLATAAALRAAYDKLRASQP